MGGRGTRRRIRGDFSLENRRVRPEGGGGVGGGGNVNGGARGANPARFSDRFTVSMNRRTSQRLNAMFGGRRIDNRTIGKLVGAPDGSRISVSSRRDGSIRIVTSNPLFRGTQLRTLTKGRDGKITIRNGNFQLASNAPRLYGLAILARQFATASRLGVSSIQTNARRGLGSGSFNTLARLGFNALVRMRGGREGNRVQLNRLLTSRLGRDRWSRAGTSFLGRLNFERTSIGRDVFTRFVRGLRRIGNI